MSPSTAHEPHHPEHDGWFKILVTTFSGDFVTLLLPDVAAYIDFDSIEFLDKEIFTDITAGKPHIVDLVLKARFRGQLTCFLIHIENQASAQSDFPRKMFSATQNPQCSLPKPLELLKALRIRL